MQNPLEFNKLDEIYSIHMIETKAIVLNSTPFEESGKILTLLTKDFGMVSAVIKTIPDKRLDLVQASTPLFSGLFHLRKGRTDLFKIFEASALHYHHIIKQDLTRLKCSIDMMKVIIQTQIKNKPIPLLYQLLTSFLIELEKSKNPELITSTFFLKFLRHEGLLNLDYFCDNTDLNIEKLEHLALSLKFEEMYVIDLTKNEIEKIKFRFKEVLEQTSI